MSEDARSGRQLLEQIRAMDELVRQDGRFPLDMFTERLVWTVGNPYGSWEGARAASMAARLLSYIQDCQESAKREWPSEHPEDLAGLDYWHPSPPGDGWRDLDSGDSRGLRDAWRTRLVGPAGPDGWLPGVRWLQYDEDEPDDDAGWVASPR